MCLYIYTCRYTATLGPAHEGPGEPIRAGPTKVWPTRAQGPNKGPAQKGPAHKRPCAPTRVLPARAPDGRGGPTRAQGIQQGPGPQGPSRNWKAQREIILLSVHGGCLFSFLRGLLDGPSLHSWPQSHLKCLISSNDGVHFCN